MLTLLIVVGCEQPAPGGYDFSQPQAEAVRALLDEEPGRRLLTASDNQSPMLADQQKSQPGYEPYFAAGDFDADGSEDFVVTVQEGESFDAYLFRGEAGGYDSAAWFAGADWLPEAGMFVKEDHSRSGNVIGIGSFFSDDAIWFGWNAETEQLEPLPSDMED